MSDLTAPQPMLPPEPPGLVRWIVWAALASLTLHAGVLGFLLWQPLPESLEAAQPPAIDVELVPPPEAASESETEEQPAEAPAAEPPPAVEPSQEAPAESAPPAEAMAADAPPVEEAQAEQTAATEQATETASAESTALAQTTAPAAAAASTSAPEAPAEAEAAETGPEAAAMEMQPPSEASGSAEAEPRQDLVVAGKIAPIPLARPAVRGLTADSGAPEDGAAATPADAVEVAEGAVTAATPEQPDVATLELGVLRSADRFYLEAMLGTPGLAPARDMLKTLPPEKRLEQTCNIEALAQIGYSGEGFTPDVVMAEAYALSEATGTRLMANGAIFRSGEKWYGVAFDCTLSDDLTEVTAFSYRLGADVTEAVLARLGN